MQTKANQTASIHNFDPWQVERAPDEQTSSPANEAENSESQEPDKDQSINPTEAHSFQKRVRNAAVAVFNDNSINLGPIALHGNGSKSIFTEIVELVQHYENLLREKEQEVREFMDIIAEEPYHDGNWETEEQI